MANNTYECQNDMCGITFDERADTGFTLCKCGAYAKKQKFPLPAKTTVGKYGKAGGLSEQQSS